MRLYFSRTRSDYVEIMMAERAELDRHMEAIRLLVPLWERKFGVKGYSYAAKKTVRFKADFKCGGDYPRLNWREQLVCPVTGLNNRMRFSMHLADTFLNIRSNSKIYLMEQLTPLFRLVVRRYPSATGSEFLGSKIPLGTHNYQGIRNEDATALTFSDNTLDAIMSFDVFEHIPNFKAALREAYRTLKPGGRILFSAPFDAGAEKHLIRAVVEGSGEIRHLLTPEYHGDPVGGEEGILCFQTFGWELIDDLRTAGFLDAYAILGWSDEFCYFTPQIQFLAIK